jgi:hypothetical protein
MRTMRGDFRHSTSKTYQIRDTKTLRLGQEAHEWRLLLDIEVKISIGRTGWLVTQCRWSPALVAFPANRFFLKSRLLAHQRLQIAAPLQAFDANSLLNGARNYFGGTGNSGARTEYYQSKSKSLLDVIFDIQGLQPRVVQSRGTFQ